MKRSRSEEIRRIGARIDHYKANALARRRKLLQTHRISLVLDVGANTGQYARGLRRSGYRGRIVSFEPVRSAFLRLQRAAAGDPRWEAVNLALGRRDGRATIHVSGDSRASSMLQMLPSHLDVAGYFGTVGQEQVQMRRLDSVLGRHVRPSDRVLLKLDVQGLEPQVLAGARASLARIAGIQVELSLTPLYRGELGIVPMLSRLQRQGFQLMSLEYGFCDPRTGRMLQVDGLLFRPLTRAGRAPRRGRPPAPRPPAGGRTSAPSPRAPRR
ncbi:MAG TPA: FkbM family methyltransferase [Myxococcales bacterium]|jgi:FkbM family methyltransferase|nr:FkbM family methyltransferase [Myxococcales bacterium]